jgi:hypothetical protein
MFITETIALVSVLGLIFVRNVPSAKAKQVYYSLKVQLNGESVNTNDTIKRAEHAFFERRKMGRYLAECFAAIFANYVIREIRCDEAFTI